MPIEQADHADIESEARQNRRRAAIEQMIRADVRARDAEAKYGENSLVTRYFRNRVCLYLNRANHP